MSSPVVLRGTEHAYTIAGVACSLDSKQLMSVTVFGGINVWNLETNERTKCIKIQSMGKVNLAFTADHTPLVAYWGVDGPCLMNVLDGKTNLLQASAGGFRPIFSPDASIVISGIEAGQVLMYDTKTLRENWRDLTHVRNEGILLISNSNNIIAYEKRDHVRLFDLSKCGTPSTVPIYLKGVRALTFSPDDDLIALTNDDGTLWDVQGKSCICKLERPFAQPFALDFSRDGKYFTATDEKCTRVWDACTGKLLKAYEESSASSWVMFSTDSRKLITVHGGEIHLRAWDKDDDGFDPDVEFADIKSAAKLS